MLLFKQTVQTWSGFTIFGLTSRLPGCCAQRGAAPRAQGAAQPFGSQYSISNNIISLFKSRPQILQDLSKVHFSNIPAWAVTIPTSALHHQSSWQTPALLHHHHHGGLWRRSSCTTWTWPRNLFLAMICATQWWGWRTRASQCDRQHYACEPPAESVPAFITAKK